MLFRSNNLEENYLEPHPGLPRSRRFQLKNISPSPSSTTPHGIPAVSPQPRAGPAQPCFPQRGLATEERLRDPGGEKWREDGINNPLERFDGRPRNTDAQGKPLTFCRLRRSIRRGRRPRPSACGSMPGLERRPTRPTAPHTSWSIWPSRYGLNWVYPGPGDG